MFEQSFKNIDNILHTDSGCGTELDYVEQTSWILFLKYLDDLEEDKKKSATLSGKSYEYILSPEYRWNNWACPKNGGGKLDHNKALDGDDLKEFVNNKLFPYLKKFKAEDPNTIEYKIGEIFSELKNKISSGYKLREILNVVDDMHFRLYEEKHELSHLYEAKIKNMGNAGRNGGEYYTPRPLIKTIVKVVNPKIGDTIYDGACGSAGFLVEAYKFLTENQAKLSSSQMATLQTKTFYGKEIKSLAYIIGIMNMILHGIEAPNIRHTNTLAENINDIQEKDRFDIILANPPFGAGIGREIQQNFPIKTGETAFLFLQHFIKILKAGGKELSLEGTGMALGMLPESTYEEGRADLEVGDILVLYTDGISECRSPAGEEFGTGRIVRAVRRLAGRPAGEILGAIFSDLREFTGGADPDDDRTVLIIKRPAERAS